MNPLQQGKVDRAGGDEPAAEGPRLRLRRVRDDLWRARDRRPRRGRRGPRLGRVLRPQDAQVDADLLAEAGVMATLIFNK